MKIYVNSTSNAPMRVRIAIALKQMVIEEVQVNLKERDQHAEDFRRMNPQGMIPVLVDGDRVITQSMAIIEYLEELKPAPPLLPQGPVARARVRSLAMVMGCDGQPLVNLRVRQYLQTDLRLTDAEQCKWIHHWMRRSFHDYEALLALDSGAGRCSCGDDWTLADVFLVPQVVMALRFGVAMEEFSRVRSIFEAAMQDERLRSVVLMDSAPAQRPTGWSSHHPQFQAIAEQRGR